MAKDANSAPWRSVVVVAIAGAAGFVMVTALAFMRPVGAERTVAADALILPLLPRREGDFVCYRGTFEGVTMDIEDWSKARMVATDRLSPDGQPYMRNTPSVLQDQRVRSFTLSLMHDARTADYSWMYDFKLMAEVDGIGSLVGAGECPWYTAGIDAQTDKPQSGNSVGLGCGIDCDGGAFGVERIFGQEAFRLHFSADLPLRMKRGCGGYGPMGLRARAGDLAVRVEKADPTACDQLSKKAGR